MLLTILGAILAFTLTWLAAPWLSKRSTRQPIPAASLETEKEVLASVRARPQRAAWLYELTKEHFTNPTVGEDWEKFTAAVLSTLPESPNRSSDATITADADWLTHHTEEVDVATDKIGIPTHRDDTTWNSETSDTAAVAAASEVFSTGEERRLLPGAAELKRANDTWVRTPTIPTRRRFGYAAAAAVSAVIAAAVGGTYTGAAAVTATLAVAILAAAAGAIAWVDTDTLFLDRLVWTIGAGTATILTVATVFLNDTPKYLMPGVVAAVAIVALFEGLNLIYRLIRGVWGQGAGDTWIAIFTLGIPAALLNSYTVAYASLMVSLGLAIVTWLAVGRKAGAGAPFAFGPMLAGGWLLAVAGTLWW